MAVFSFFSRNTAVEILIVC